MKIVTLGTGSPLPDPNRAGPCTLVRVPGADILVDCGRGALMRAAAAGVMPGMVHSLLLTHLHSDHITDVNDLITMRWAMSMVENPLVIWGPPGTVEFIDRTLTMLTLDIGYRLAHHEDLDWQPPVDVHEVHDGPVELGVAGLDVLAAPTDHAPVHPTVGYRFTTADGVAALAGDTVPCEGLDRLCADADVYVQTTIRAALIAAIPFQRLQDILDYHSSIEQAADTAKRNNVGTLLITHMVPAPTPDAEGEQPWIDEAHAVFDGEVIIARDLLEVAVGGVT